MKKSCKNCARSTNNGNTCPIGGCDNYAKWKRIEEKITIDDLIKIVKKLEKRVKGLESEIKQKESKTVIYGR